MTQSTKLLPVAIKILGKDYRVACAENEQEALIRSAQELDKQMREIRDSGKVNGADRIAVMAALNLTHELRQTQGSGVITEGAPLKQEIRTHLTHLCHKIEHVLESS